MAKVNIEELLNSNQPIYVVNRTKTPGRILLTVANPGTGRVELVQIPVTWVPICITDMVPREALKSSMDFRKYVLHGILEIISPEEAKKLLSQPEAKAELERLYHSQYADVEAKTEAMEDLSEGPEEVQPKVADIILRLEQGTLPSGAAINALKSIQHTLTTADLEFIVNNSPSTKVRRWAEALLS